MTTKPTLHTSLSPALLNLYDVSNSIVVIIDVLRATSTIATALYNGAKCVIPVDSVTRCMEIGRQIEGITAGERDGLIAEGLEYGNSPFEYPREFVEGKTLVLTTTNGTRLLHMALEKGAKQIVTGSFPNLSAVCQSLTGIPTKCDSRLCRLEGPGKYRRHVICRSSDLQYRSAFFHQLRFITPGRNDVRKSEEGPVWVYEKK